ncbi:MAG: hypothetical protein IPG53_02790 [Ignavibacteriales bacterium]|nr:hypothetical protein [Ignavibacteriales bacterium]
MKFNNSVVTGDEIGFFDGELCVGSVAIGDTGKYNGIAWGEDPGNGLLDLLKVTRLKLSITAEKTVFRSYYKQVSQLLRVMEHLVRHHLPR